MAAYHEHAMRLGYSNGEIHAFMQAALAKIAVGGLTADEWVAQVMQAGEMGVKVMALLDEANTTRYGNPEITKVNIGWVRIRVF